MLLKEWQMEMKEKVDLKHCNIYKEPPLLNHTTLQIAITRVHTITDHHRGCPIEVHIVLAFHLLEVLPLLAP